MMTLDTITLTAVIKQCFANAGDEQFSLQDRVNFLADGKRLRGQLLNLISAQFNDGTQAVADANNQLQTINNELSVDATTLANTADQLDKIATLISNLDQLLSIAAKFV